MPNYEIERELQSSLSPGEELLWTGRPKTGLVFRKTDFFMIPFSLIWFGFVIFWITMTVKMGAPLIFTLFGVPFLFVGAYITFGRYIIDARNRANTRYGLTRERILIRTGAGQTTLTSLNIATLGTITLEQKADGTGTIILGENDITPIAFQSARRYAVKQAPRLEFVDNVQAVYNQILELQRGR
jgi:hypothetical protein